MILRKPPHLVCLQNLSPCLPTIRGSRSYATVDDAPHDHEAHAWPTAPKYHTHPTPYQILGLPQHASYSKSRFYRLVKLYHPDRCNSPHTLHPSLRDIKPAIRLERYRLVVAAHTLLSDPAKRAAYDRSGVGWTGEPLTAAARARRYENPEDDPMCNATWEDWERWYKRTAFAEAERERARNGGNAGVQRPLYFANATVAAAVIVFVALGSMGQSGRVKANVESVNERRDLTHEQASSVLRGTKSEARRRVPDTKDEHITEFLMRMNPSLSRKEAERLQSKDGEHCGDMGMHGRS